MQPQLKTAHMEINITKRYVHGTGRKQKPTVFVDSSNEKERSYLPLNLFQIYPISSNIIQHDIIKSEYGSKKQKKDQGVTWVAAMLQKTFWHHDSVQINS